MTFQIYHFLQKNDQTHICVARTHTPIFRGILKLFSLKMLQNVENNVIEQKTFQYIY